jgi:nucleotide-binding universal stress UspA family protein
VPWLPIIAIVLQAALTIALFDTSWMAWVAALTWAFLGILVFQRLGARAEAALEADKILLEETIAERPFSLLLPVANAPEARQMARIASSIAYWNDGEIFALHVTRVPQQLSLSDGRAFLKHSRPLLEEVIRIGKEHDVPVRTQLRLGRDIGRSILSAARERKSSLIMLGWPGSTSSVGSAFGNTIDLISANPPTDLAVVRIVRSGLPTRIMVPVVKNRNSKLALEIAFSQAQFAATQNGDETKIVAVHLVPIGLDRKEIEARRLELIDELELEDTPIELRIISCEHAVEAILNYAEEFDEIVIGAPEERLLEHKLFGSVPQQVAEDALVNVIMVKRHDPIKHGLLGRWLGRVPANKRYHSGSD